MLPKTYLKILVVVMLGMLNFMAITSMAKAAKTTPLMTIETLTFTMPQAITHSVKTVSDSLVKPGALVTYTVFITTSETVAEIVSLVDNLPTELQLVEKYKSSGLFPPTANNAVSWSGSVSLDTPVWITYSALLTNQVVGGRVILNTAQIINSHEVSVNKTATITAMAANLTFTETVMPADTLVQPGDLITYNVTISNQGNLDATGVQINVLLSPFVSGTSVSTTTTVMAGNNVILAVPVTVKDNPAADDWLITHTASYIFGESSATLPSSLKASKPKLSISKSVAYNKPVLAGDTVTYTIIITNKGKVEAKQVRVRDTLPPTVSGNNLDASFMIPPGESITIPPIIGTLLRSTPNGQIITNTAYYTHALQQDKAEAGFLFGTALTPKLVITKMVALSSKPVRPHDIVTYTIIVTNEGTAEAVDVQVQDTLPSQLMGDDLDKQVTIKTGEGKPFIITATLRNDLPEGQFLVTNTASYQYGDVSDQAMATFMAGELKVYVPVIVKQPPSEPTPTPSLTPTPSPTPTAPAVPTLQNADFESGSTGWQQSSSTGLELIVKAQELPRPVTPHNGNQVVWMGGRVKENADLWQEVSIPSGFSASNVSFMLSYYYWIASDDSCGNDRAWVEIEKVGGSPEILKPEHNVCGKATSWSQKSYDLTSFEGQTIKIHFRLLLNDSKNSNFFIDDVELKTR